METSKARGPPAGPVTPITVFRHKQRHPLNAIFAPKSVAVVGATEKAGSVGRTLLMFGRILVPLDGSEQAERAIPAAARIARSSGGTIVFVRVILPPVE